MQVALDSLAHPDTGYVCGAAEMGDVHAVYLYVGNGGTDPFYIDNVRAE